MNILTRIVLAAYLGLATEGTACSEPNIVLIMADDLGWADTSNAVTTMGHASDYYETPAIDRLAEGGMAFTNAYTNGPNCAPTRSAILTGQYAQRPTNNVYQVGNLNRGGAGTLLVGPPQGLPDGDDAIPREAYTYAENVRDHTEYVVAHFGKFHVTADPDFVTSQHGFDYNCGGDKSGSPGAYHAQGGRFHRKIGPELNRFGSAYTQRYVDENIKPYSHDVDDGWIDALVGSEKHVSDAMTDAAIHFMEQAKSGSFLVQFHPFAVHTPIGRGQARADLLRKYEAKTPGARGGNAAFGALIEGMDQNVARVIDFLQTTPDPRNHGHHLDENTIVIFFSDNGGKLSQSNNRPLKGQKGELDEGGIRVPLVVWSGNPLLVAPGTVADTPVAGFDLYPTISSLTCAGLPENVAVDGVDLSSVWSGASTNVDRDALYWHLPGYLGTNGRDQRPQSVIRSGRWKLLYSYEDASVELYDLANDIGETTNLAARHRDVVESLVRQLMKWLESTGAPLARLRAGALEFGVDGLIYREGKIREHVGKLRVDEGEEVPMVLNHRTASHGPNDVAPRLPLSVLLAFVCLFSHRVASLLGYRRRFDTIAFLCCLAGACGAPQAARAITAGSVKGVILKITDAGTADGNVVPEPLTSNPGDVVLKLNAEGVGEVRVQVNDGVDLDAVTTTGADAVNTLASLGFNGKAILDNKKWNLQQSGKQMEWADRMYDTYQKLSAEGKALVGGYSFGETTPNVLTWDDYSGGVVATVNELQQRFLSDSDPTNDESLAGMKVFVGGASFGGTFKNLTQAQHDAMKSAIESVGATMIYSYKSFHSNQGMPQPGPADEITVAAATDWLNNEVGLANLAAVAPDTQVKYRGDARDRITNNSNRYQAIIDIFNQHDNFLHIGAEKVIDAVDSNGGDLFEDDGSPRSGPWNDLTGMFNAVDRSPVEYAGLPASRRFDFQINTNSDNRPFFAAGGSSGYEGAVESGASSSSLVGRERITIVGSATENARYLDGNGVPKGVAISLDVSFDLSTPSGLLVDGGNNGLGVDSGTGSATLLEPGEQLRFGQIGLANVVVRDPENLIVDGSEAFGASWSVLRSNDFNEASEGVVVSSDSAATQDVSAFGVAGTGAIDNNFTAGEVGLLDVIYVTTTQGEWRIKGIGYSLDVSFLVNAPLAGDYNNDGVVDAADYTSWRDREAGAEELTNETESLGVVDILDYDAWVANYGSGSFDEQANATQAPELSSMALTLGFCIPLLLREKHRR